MILVAITILLLVAFLLWYAFGPWDDDWRVERDQYDAPLFRKRGRR